MPPLRILYLEDDPRDAELLQATLEAEDIFCDVTRVETEADFSSRIERGDFDLVLADYTLPSFDGVSALKISKKIRPDVPFIFVTGTLGEEVAIEALKLGATDYVFKTKLSRIVPSAQRALREAAERNERKRAEEELRRSRAYLAEAQMLSHTGSFGWNVSTGDVYWSEETLRIFQFDPESQPNLETAYQRIHPQDREAVHQAQSSAVAAKKDFDYEHRLVLPDGSVRYVRVVGRPREELGKFEYVGAVTDITERKQAESLLAAEKRSLEMIATGANLTDILEDLCNAIDSQSPRVISSVLMMDPDGKRLWPAAGPKVPDGWARAIAGRTIGPNVGSCGTAAFLRKRVITTDIASDPLWVDYRDAALSYGLRASWSQPLISKNHEVLGTFAMYYAEPRSPQPGDLQLIEAAGHIAVIAIERKRAEEALRRSEAYLAEAQRLSQTGSFGWDVSSGNIYWSLETFRIFGCEPGTTPSLDLIVQRTHPEDREFARRMIAQVSQEGKDFDFEHRLLLPDGSVKHLRVVGHPSREKDSQKFEFVGAVTDITERKRAELLLRESEQRFRAVFDEAGMGIALVDLVSGAPIDNNRALQKMMNCTWDELSRIETYDELTSPEDRDSDATLYQELCRGEREILRQEKHQILRDGREVWANVVFTLLRDSEGRPSRTIAVHEDITERKRAEAALRQSEASLLEAQRISHMGSWTHDLKSGRVSASPEMLRIFDVKPGENASTREFFSSRVHPDDWLEATSKTDEAVLAKTDFESDWRIVLPDGSIKYLHNVGHPKFNVAGELIEFVGTSIDVTEQHAARTALETAFEQIKTLRDQLYKENIALRDEVDKASMFEEIVGESPALQSVLTRVAKIAPSDSTVLLTGETGTGKELIARAVHKRSQRSWRAFVTVNCAAIPASLIASELFGHEKGAFTGALQRRLGRFELAEGGTIFLDEIGELPMESQVTLLRVLQEREFERVGGSQPIRADVRVIAATNRDLQSAIAAGEFRRDLFYRLNVIPMEIPPLRERKEDIPVLIEYFIDRYARKVGKKIRTIDHKTLELLQSYSWPGNIRELQNVIERSVVICDSEVFSVDPGWLTPSSSVRTNGGPARSFGRPSADEEKRLIEAALAEAHGRVSGPSGAAAQLGMPASTLESKIRTLNIDKYRFKRA
jgi:PAS domain S-box-containing protein